MSQTEFDRLEAAEFTVEEIHAAWEWAQRDKAYTADAIVRRLAGGNPGGRLLDDWRRKEIVCRALGQMQDRALVERERQARKTS